MASTVEILRYAKAAGWPGGELITAAAIALAESGGNPNARGDISLQTSTWGPSIGLWQIRSLKAEYGKGTTRDEKANYDPQTNANHAYAIWKQSGWGAWSTHSGPLPRYLAFVPQVTAAAPLAGIDLAVDDAKEAVSGPVDAVLEVAQEPIRVLKWLADPGTQIRIAKVIVGGGLVVAALVKLVGGSVMSVLPVGKVAKVAGKLAK